MQTDAAKLLLALLNFPRESKSRLGNGLVNRLPCCGDNGSFCHSERSEESLLFFIGENRREILRFAQNDKREKLSERWFRKKSTGQNHDLLGSRDSYSPLVAHRSIKPAEDDAIDYVP
jgi:hypothetical protein